jgi:hypothetical protein
VQWQVRSSKLRVAFPSRIKAVTKWVEGVSAFMALSISQGELASTPQVGTERECSHHHSFQNAYITWINNGTKAWTLMAAGMGPDTQSEVRMILSIIYHETGSDTHTDWSPTGTRGTNGQYEPISRCRS